MSLDIEFSYICEIVQSLILRENSFLIVVLFPLTFHNVSFKHDGNTGVGVNVITVLRHNLMSLWLNLFGSDSLSVQLLQYQLLPLSLIPVEPISCLSTSTDRFTVRVKMFPNLRFLDQKCSSFSNFLVVHMKTKYLNEFDMLTSVCFW